MVKVTETFFRCNSSPIPMVEVTLTFLQCIALEGKKDNSSMPMAVPWRWRL